MKGKVGCLRVCSGEEPSDNANVPVCTKEVSVKAHKSISKRAHINTFSMKQCQDRKLYSKSFRPGDHVDVLCTQEGKSTKFKKFLRIPYQVKKKMSDVTYLVDCDRQGKDQVIHVDHMKRLHSQKLVGEDSKTNDQAGQIEKDESASHKQSFKDEEYDSAVNNFSDLPTIPMARSGRQIRKPAWHADYEM